MSSRLGFSRKGLGKGISLLPNPSSLMRYFFRHAGLFLFTITQSIAQREANIWYFGANAGLDFNSGAPVPLTNGPSQYGRRLLRHQRFCRQPAVLYRRSLGL